MKDRYRFVAFDPSDNSYTIASLKCGLDEFVDGLSQKVSVPMFLQTLAIDAKAYILMVEDIESGKLVVPTRDDEEEDIVEAAYDTLKFVEDVQSFMLNRRTQE